MPNRQHAIIWTSTDLLHWFIYAALGGNELTAWGLNKMADSIKATFSNTFYLMKMFEFLVKCHWSVFLGVQVSFDSANIICTKQVISPYLNQCWTGLIRSYGITRRQRVKWRNDPFIYWRIQSLLVWIIACHLIGNKQLHKPMMACLW